MEIITNNELIDEIRVKEGLILRVEKYEKDKMEVKIDIDKKYLKKVSGKNMSKFKQVKKDIVNETEDVIFKEDEYIVNDWGRWRRVNMLTNPQDYYIELKCTSGSIGGYSSKFASIIREVQSIVKERYGV